jgi:cell division protein ZapA (FtsZ GTPase activity inhibitor)
VSKVKSQPIDVEIYDQKYKIVLQTPLDEAEIRVLAEELDRRMREIAEVSATADSLRVAILAALHLALEFQELKKRCEQNDVLINSKTAELSRTLEQVLKKSG